MSNVIVKHFASYNDVLKEAWLRARNSGEIAVTTVSGVRIALKDLSDEQIAEILNYYASRMDLHLGDLVDYPLRDEEQ